MVKARKYVVKNKFEGFPKRSDYEIVEEELPPIKVGEILLKTEFISVEPYFRTYNKFASVPYDQFGFQVGIVEESKDPSYPIGTRAITYSGWRDYSIVTPIKMSSTNILEAISKIPDVKGISPSVYLGAAGVTGVVGYFGFLELCQPKAGETVVVSSAAGAVGSVVGQIAKLKGCKVIGIAGSDDKVRWLEKELGFDKAINYKTDDIQKALQAAAPEGVDCYFDAVGGEISSTIIGQMNNRGRVSVCGYSSYDESGQLPVASILQPSIIGKQLKIEGYLGSRWADRWSEGVEQLITWIKRGLIKPSEHVTEGFDNIFNAFAGMLAGENLGKAVVKI